MAGYSLANFLTVSGPLAMVAAGILVGNFRSKKNKQRVETKYVDKFWEIIDDTLNSVLFVLMGLELLTIKYNPSYFLLGIIAIFIALAARYVSIFVPARLLLFKEKIPHSTLLILTWGGLRGGLSFALALSLKPEMHKDLWVTVTYFIVSFSVLIQGLSIGRVARKIM